MKNKPVRPAESDPWRPAVVYCDVAGGQTDAHTGLTSEAVLRRAGFVVKSRAQHVEDGIGMLMELIDPALNEGNAGVRFFVSPACPKLIEALEKYQRGPGHKPVKDGEHDHLIDALRYAVVGDAREWGKVVVGKY